MDPRKILADLALTLALSGDCLADAAMLPAEPAVFGSGLGSGDLAAGDPPGMAAGPSGS